MNEPQKPLGFWDLSATRRTVAISFFVAVGILAIGFFPSFHDYYANHSAVQDFFSALAVLSGLVLAFLELNHSGEANQHRKDMVRLTGEANGFSAEIVRLQDERLKLQNEVYQLQLDIERRLTKIRLYARVHSINKHLKLFVSNLSGFDLWLNQVEVIVTEGGKIEPHNRTIGGATRLSDGEMKEDFLFYGTVMRINNDISDRFDMKFHVKVVVTGVDDKAVTINSPEYKFQLSPGGELNLIVINYSV